jgi:signal transduction histidine kinase
MSSERLPRTGTPDTIPGGSFRSPLASKAGLREFARTTFHGLTWKRFGIFCAALAFASLQDLNYLDRGDPLPITLGHLIANFATRLMWMTPPLLAVVATINRSPAGSRALPLHLGAAIVVAVLTGRVLREAVLAALVSGYVPLAPEMVAAGSLTGCGVVALGTMIYLSVVREAQAREDLQRAALARIGAERMLSEGTLRVMQAQIEPHFLFNSLANVRRLCQIDLDAGRRMLRHVVAYLAASLPQMRDERSTLGREVALAEAYLRVQQIRMGDRLTIAVDVPDALRSVAFPPLTVVTLAENAIKHGVGPLPEGGAVCIRAYAQHGRLLLEVVDDGRGLSESGGGGSGVGLANIDARLAFAHGNDARLKLSQNAAKGATALIEIPMPAGHAPGLALTA